LLGHRVSTLLADAGRLAALREAARVLGRPQAARDIAADALRFLSSPAV
jgi:UDP-N-acetylglucosamine:LPS N-acetylglucosamine transferase